MFNVYMMCYKADRTHQNSSRLSNIHYASINNKYMSEFIEKNVLPLIFGLPRKRPLLFCENFLSKITIICGKNSLS